MLDLRTSTNPDTSFNGAKLAKPSNRIGVAAHQAAGRMRSLVCSLVRKGPGIRRVVATALILGAAMVGSFEPAWSQGGRLPPIMQGNGGSGGGVNVRFCGRYWG
jgi:hypothetical protein